MTPWRPARGSTRPLTHISRTRILFGGPEPFRRGLWDSYPSNEPYATAKLAGIKLCESFNRQYGASHGVDFRSVVPTNLHGPGDNYHPQNSHVIPALIRRFHEAKVNGAREVVI